MCEPELNILNLSLNYNTISKYITEIEDSYFDKDKCNKAYNILIKHMEENNSNDIETRKIYVSKLYTLLIWMLNGPYCKTFKKDIRLLHLFNYSYQRALYFTTLLTNKSTINLLSILNEYKRLWSQNIPQTSRLETKYKQFNIL